jgi:hypothetical protein
MAEDVLVLQDIGACTAADWAAWKTDKSSGKSTTAKLSAKRSTSGVVVQSKDRQSNSVARLGSLNQQVGLYFHDRQIRFDV